jgi:hypothetical protein
VRGLIPTASVAVFCHSMSSFSAKLTLVRQ